MTTFQMESSAPAATGPLGASSRVTFEDQPRCAIHPLSIDSGLHRSVVSSSSARFAPAHPALSSLAPLHQRPASPTAHLLRIHAPSAPTVNPLCGISQGNRIWI